MFPVGMSDYDQYFHINLGSVYFVHGLFKMLVFNLFGISYVYVAHLEIDFVWKPMMEQS